MFHWKSVDTKLWFVIGRDLSNHYGSIGREGIRRAKEKSVTWSPQYFQWIPHRDTMIFW